MALTMQIFSTLERLNSTVLPSHEDVAAIVRHEDRGKCSAEPILHYAVRPGVDFRYCRRPPKGVNYHSMKTPIDDMA